MTTESDYDNDGSLRKWVVGSVALVIVLTVLEMACDSNMEADRPNWGTAVILDLPVDVTREIFHFTTTFTYSPRGDERAVFFLQGNRVDKGMKIDVDVTADSPVILGPWPTVGLRVIRNNGTVEDYQIPTRGGAVREESTPGNATGVSP